VPGDDLIYLNAVRRCTEMHRKLRSRRGGILLDGVLSIVFLALAAYSLSRLGITLPQIVAGIRQFIG
jgi:hypothetical protein